MKFLNKMIIASSLFLSLFTTAFAAAETYNIDPTHTYVLWHISHFGFSNPSGKWMVAEGKIILDEAKPQDSKVDITIHTADLVTGFVKLDEHLKSNTFFDVAKFPTATFVSDKVDVTGKDTAKVHGMLTLHGVTKPITLDVKLNALGMHPISNKKTAGFSATANLKRSDYDMKAYLPGLGDDVVLDIQVEASKA